MPSQLSGINTALQAILAHQQTMQVIEHNVANANTPGYHRQEAVLKAGIPTAYSNLLGFYAGEMGSGVTVAQIKRYSIDFFDTRYRGQVSDAKRWSLESGVLKQIEATLNESGDDGLVARLDAFWGGWQNLSVDPTNTALKADLLQRATALADGIKGRNTQLNQIRMDQNLELTQRAEEVNTLAAQIAQINVEVVHVLSANQQPNDLMDQRDQLADRLAELTGSRADLQPNGMLNVSIHGHNLVDGGNVMKLNITRSAVSSTITWADGGAFAPTSGELAGLIDLRDTVIPNYQQNLDQLAYSLATQVNAIHNPGGTPSDPPYHAAGMDFFNPLPGGVTGAAGLIGVNPAMSSLGNIMGASAAYPEDGSIARLIANIQSAPMAALGNVSLNEFYTQKAAELGLFTRQAQGYAQERGLVASALGQQRESVMGVNLNEEAANMVKAQKAFEAATRMVNVMDDMLDRIINGMGLVGR